MRTPSANAVSSPLTSMTLTSSFTLRTSIVTCAWGISALLSRPNSLTPSYSPRSACSEPCSSPASISGRPAQGALLVREDAHEVREAGYVEDLDVVVAEAVGHERALGGPGSCEQAHEQGYPGRVYVVHLHEVEEDGVRVERLRLGVGRVEGLLGEAVDLASEVEHGAAWLLAHPHLKVPHGHHLPPSLSSRCRINSTVWWGWSPVTFISSTMLLMRKSPQPRGVCTPSSFASRSGVSESKAGGPLPSSVILTKRSASEAETSMMTGVSARYWLPCSIAFIVASATAVLSLSRVGGGNPSPFTAPATTSIARRSLPGSLGTLSSASVRREPLLGAVTAPPISPG